jgi:hypothetical protein
MSSSSQKASSSRSGSSDAEPKTTVQAEGEDLSNPTADSAAEENTLEELADHAASPSLLKPPPRPVSPAKSASTATTTTQSEVAATEHSVANHAQTLDLDSPPPGTDMLGGIQQPIPSPSEPLQFRAIGLVQGIYEPSEEHFNRGVLITREGLRLDAVLLGQVMSLVKKYLTLTSPYLWVVYPRTREEEPMHVQLVGVWSPEGFALPDTDEETDEGVSESDVAEAPIVDVSKLEASLSPLESLIPPLQDGFFSIRGQVIQQFVDQNQLFVKINQVSRKKADTAKAFKLKLHGTIPQKPMGYFWEFEVLREGTTLVIQKATPVAFIPMKKKKKGAPPRKGGYRDEHRPFSKGPEGQGDDLPMDAGSKRSLPKLIKRQDQATPPTE